MLTELKRPTVSHLQAGGPEKPGEVVQAKPQGLGTREGQWRASSLSPQVREPNTVSDVPGRETAYVPAKQRANPALVAFLF